MAFKRAYWLTRDCTNGPIDMWASKPVRLEGEREWQGLGHVGRLRLFETAMFKLDVTPVEAVRVTLQT